MKVSVVTVCLDAERYIVGCLQSVASQDLAEVEHVIVDGGSRDRTGELVSQHLRRDGRFVTGRDEGIYDAMNKGLAMSTGDVVCFLNADDVYSDQSVLRRIVGEFREKRVQAVTGRVVIVSRDVQMKPVRSWTASGSASLNFRWGWHPPHPAFFMLRSMFIEYGGFDTRFHIAADYELMLRYLLRFRCSCVFLPSVLVKMRAGGVSNGTLQNVWRANVECRRAWKVNGLRPPVGLVFLKPMMKWMSGKWVGGGDLL